MKVYSKKVTVFIATYNQCKFLEDALLSVLNQDCPRRCFEIIVINDGSTDKTKKILSKYEKEIRVFHQERAGLPATCNRGIKKAQGEYFIRLDSDDFFDLKMLSLTVPVLDSYPQITAVFSDRILLSEGQKEVILVPDNDLYSMVASGVLMRTEQLKEIGGYRDIFWEEYDLFLRLSKLGPFKHIPRPLYFYRKHSKNMTDDMELRKKGWSKLIAMNGKEAVVKAGNYNQFDELNEILSR